MNDLQKNFTFETLESRLVMSAQALTEFVSQFEVETPAIDVEQRIEALSTPGGENTFDNDIASIRERYNLSGEGQTIAVIDSGIFFEHEAFGGGFGPGQRVVGGFDFAEMDANPRDDGPLGFHGTHVAGIIGANSDSFTGLAPEADLVALRVFDDNGGGELEYVEQALQYVIDNRDAFEHPITTVNLSIGTQLDVSSSSEAAILDDELARLEDLGIFISVAAGNRFGALNTTGVAYPASSDFVIPVGSHGADGQISDFSQRNSDTLFAPGEQILSTVPDHIFTDGRTDSIIRTSGTSQAAPFVAGASALLREALQRTGVENIDQDLLYDKFVESADVIFDSVTGLNYNRINLERAIATALSDDHGDSYTTSTDVGLVDGNEVISGTIGSFADRDYFSFTAQNDGQVILTVSGQDTFVPQISTSTSATQTGNQIIFDVEAGQSYDFFVNSSEGLGEYQIEFATSEIAAGPVTLNSDGLLSVKGTAGNDSVKFQTGENISVTVNGETFQFERSEVERVIIQGGGGKDQLATEFNNDIGNSILNTQRVDITSSDLNFSAVGFENIDLNANGQTGRLVVRDSAGDERFEAGIQNVMVDGNGFNHTAAGFSTIIIRASAGNDQIQLNGSANSDRFISDEFRHTLRDSHGRVTATQFDRVNVSGRGGQDIATVRDTVGADAFTLNDRRFELQNTNLSLSGNGFERISAISRNGDDTLSVIGTDGDESVIQRTERFRLNGERAVNIATGFQQIKAELGSGVNSVRIFDSNLDDRLLFTTDSLRLENAYQVVDIAGADQINVIGNQGGQDTAVIQGTDGADTLFANGNRAELQLSNGNEINVRGFENIQVDTLGGNDSTQLIGTNERDLIRSLDNQLSFESTRRMLQIVNAEQHRFDGRGGNDEATVEGFGALDLLEAVGDGAIAYLNSQQIELSDIEFLEARTASGQSSNYDISAVDFLFLLDGQWEESQ